MAHPHAENMRLYAEDAAETDRPWRFWQVRDRDYLGILMDWSICANHPEWRPEAQYRRKPRTVTITGPGGTFEYPEPMREAPECGTIYHVPVSNAALQREMTHNWNGDRADYKLLRMQVCHTTIEAAQQHARAWILASGGSLNDE